MINHTDEKSKEFFIERGKYCRSKQMNSPGATGRCWRQAAEVYEHLAVCDKSHSMKNDGMEKCLWPEEKENNNAK